MNILEARRRVLGGEVYKKTAEGNPVSVRSLARMRPGLSIMGKSTQNTTTGANLLTPFPNSGISGKIRYEMTNDGAYHIRGEDDYTRDVYILGYSSEYVPFLDEGTYTMHSENIPYGLEFYIVIKDRTGGSTNINNFIEISNSSKTFSVEKGDTFRVFLRAQANISYDNAINIIVNEGSTSLPWEPYTGGQPSPSLDYPQEITSAGDDGSIGVDVYGGNLLDIGILTDLIISLVKYFPIEVGSGSFTLSSNVPHKNNVHNLFLLAGNVSEGANSALNGVGNGVDRTVTSVDGYVTVGARLSSDNPNNPLDYDIMLNAGTAGLPYEPYKQPQSLTVQTPNGLPGIPVQSGGNYTDADGQQWVCDEIDFKRGKYVKRVTWVTFDGSEDEIWNFDSGGPSQSLTRGLVQMRGMCSQKKRNRVLCNRRIYSPTASYDTENTCFSDSAIIYIYGEKATAATESEWRQELSEKPVTVLYELETPIETDLSEEQMAAYVNLHTNRPTTVVSATDGAGLEITYKTKKSLEVT